MSWIHLNMTHDQTDQTLSCALSKTERLDDRETCDTEFRYCLPRGQMLSKSSIIAQLLQSVWQLPLPYSNHWIITATSMKLAILAPHFKTHSNTKMATTRAMEQYCSRLPKST